MQHNNKYAILMVTKKDTYLDERLVVQSSNGASLFAKWHYHIRQNVNEIRKKSESKTDTAKRTAKQ